MRDKAGCATLATFQLPRATLGGIAQELGHPTFEVGESSRGNTIRGNRTESL